MSPEVTFVSTRDYLVTPSPKVWVIKWVRVGRVCDGYLLTGVQTENQRRDDLASSSPKTAISFCFAQAIPQRSLRFACFGMVGLPAFYDLKCHREFRISSSCAVTFIAKIADGLFVWDNFVIS